MLNVTDRDGSLKSLVKINNTGVPIKMYAVTCSANAQILTVPSGTKSFMIINRGVNGATTTYEDYTIMDGVDYTELVESTELYISRDAGVNRYFDQTFTVTPGSNSRLKIIYIK